MNKQEIEKAIPVLEKYHDLLIEVYVDYSVYSKAENYNDKSLELASRANTVKNAVGTAITCMEQQLNNGWIPAPPPTGTECLAQTTNDEIIHTYYAGDSKYHFVSYYDRIVKAEVKYWQPLPEPYKAE